MHAEEPMDILQQKNDEITYIDIFGAVCDQIKYAMIVGVYVWYSGAEFSIDFLS